MNKFIFAIVALASVANAAHYGAAPSVGYGAAPSAGYGAPAKIVIGPPAHGAIIPPPHYWNPIPSHGPITPLHAINIKAINAPAQSAAPLVSAHSNPTAAASAASASVPLRAGKYTMLVVPSWEVSNGVVPQAAGPLYPTGTVHIRTPTHAAGYGSGVSHAGYGGHAASVY